MGTLNVPALTEAFKEIASNNAAYVKPKKEEDVGQDAEAAEETPGEKLLPCVL